MMTERMAKPTPCKSATRSKSPPKAGAKAKPGPDAQRLTEEAASSLIDERIRSLGDWRAETLAEVRRLIHETDPDIMEDRKWIAGGHLHLLRSDITIGQISEINSNPKRRCAP